MNTKTPVPRSTIEQLFRPGTYGRIGVEVELIPSFADGSAVVPQVLTAAFDASFRDAARPSFEPGGQLELSPGPRPSVAALMDDLNPLLARADSVAQALGVTLSSVGTDPWRSCRDVPLRLRTPRYLAMQRRFDRFGRDGRRMMRLTASLQVAVDLQPGRAGVEQWLVANLAGPALAAVFANSPSLDGADAGIPGARTRIWQGVEPSRTGYDGRHLDLSDPVGGYAGFASAAVRLGIPEAASHGYHLGTLFPPVRPRGGYLEVRYLDAQPPERVGEAVSTLAVLLLEPRARAEALELLIPDLDRLPALWSQAARGESTNRDSLQDIVTGGASRMPAGYLPDLGVLR